ncbi:MAG: hypothetical protein ACTHU0_01230 [Kofleriaceae bacterium]
MRFAFLVSLLSVAAAACGDDGVHHLPDAPPVPDARDPRTVTLTISRGRAPQPGVEVHFQNADSSLVATVRTDENGVAAAAMDAGGFVTAVAPFDRLPQGVDATTLFSYAGVKPGDELKLNDLSLPDLIGVDVRVPIEPSASRYVLHTSCNFGEYDVSGSSGSGSGSSGPGGQIELPACGTTDVLLETEDVDGIPDKYLYLADVAVSEGGTIDLTGQAYRDVADVTYTYTHVPSGVSGVFGVTMLMNATGTSHYRVFGTAVDNGFATTTERRPTPPGVRHLVSSELITGGYGTHFVDEWGPVGDYALDLEGMLLREYATRPVFDAADHALTWTTMPTGVDPDLVYAHLRFVRNGTRAWRWHLVAPAGATDALVFPVLPGDAQQFNPLATDTVEYENLQTAKVAGGYDAIREVFYSDRVTSVMSSPTGRLVLQNLAFGTATRQRRAPGSLGLHRPVTAR